MMLTLKDIEAGEKLSKEATPGKWKYDHGNWEVEQSKTRDSICGLDNSCRLTINGEMTAVPAMFDGEFIAHHNPAHMLELYEHIHMSLAMMKVMREALEFYANPYSWGCGESAANGTIDDSDLSECSNAMSDNGGKRAREALGRIK
jgi:hypothetical protein